MTPTRTRLEDKAKKILVEHGLYSVPVDPVVLANKLGIKVHNAKFSDEGLAALIAKRGSSITILLDESDPPYRKRFSIAHELAHHFLHLESDGEIVDQNTDMFRFSEHDTDSTTPDRRREVEANQFAAALLMPRELMLEEWPKYRSIKKLAKLFNVSETAMGIRIDTLGLN